MTTAMICASHSPLLYCYAKAPKDWDAMQLAFASREKAAQAYLAHVDELGGMVSAIEQGYVQREIQAAAYRFQLDVEAKRRLVVGQNAFETETEPIPVLKVDPAIERDQVERLRAWREQRDSAKAEEACTALKAQAEGEDNLMPGIITAVKAGATVGEIAAALRTVWGEYEQVVTL